jgi:RNA polymerase-binding transcription factor DksA
MNEKKMPVHDDLSRIDVARIRQALIAAREELRNSAGDRSALLLKRVETALGKLERGGYGICEACVQPMLKARLLALPHVRYCISCSGGTTGRPVPQFPMRGDRFSATRRNQAGPSLFR